MFRKLVSALPFSPALVGQLGLYARRLRREQTMRQLGLVFIVLALGIQALAFFRPPEPTRSAPIVNECTYNAAITKDDNNCKPCPYNASLWISDRGCSPNVTLAIDAFNLSSNTVATAKRAEADDRIQYNLHTTNTSDTAITIPVEISLTDLLEYGTAIDLGGGNLSQDGKKVTWGAVIVGPKQADVRSFVLQLDNKLPTTPQAVDNSLSYDCKLTNTYGNTLNIMITCPPSKVVEGILRTLPHMGFGPNVVFAVMLFTLAFYLYARSKQLNRELKLVRKDFNHGPM